MYLHLTFDFSQNFVVYSDIWTLSRKNTCNVRQWVLRRGHWQLPNFSQNFTLLLSYVVPVKCRVKILQNFVAFSEYMNFKYCYQEKNTCNVRQWVLRRGHWQRPNFSQMRPKGGHAGGHRDQATLWNDIDRLSSLKWSFPFWIRCHWVSCTERWRSSGCTRPKCPRVRGWHTCLRKSRYRHPASKGRIWAESKENIWCNILTYFLMRVLQNM